MRMVGALAFGPASQRVHQCCREPVMSRSDPLTPDSTDRPGETHDWRLRSAVGAIGQKSGRHDCWRSSGRFCALERIPRLPGTPRPLRPSGASRLLPPHSLYAGRARDERRIFTAPCNNGSTYLMYLRNTLARFDVTVARLTKPGPTSPSEGPRCGDVSAPPIRQEISIFETQARAPEPW